MEPALRAALRERCPLTYAWAGPPAILLPVSFTLPNLVLPRLNPFPQILLGQLPRAQRAHSPAWALFHPANEACCSLCRVSLVAPVRASQQRRPPPQMALVQWGFQGPPTPVHPQPHGPVPVPSPLGQTARTLGMSLTVCSRKVLLNEREPSSWCPCPGVPGAPTGQSRISWELCKGCRGGRWGGNLCAASGWESQSSPSGVPGALCDFEGDPSFSGLSVPPWGGTQGAVRPSKESWSELVPQGVGSE